MAAERGSSEPPKCEIIPDSKEIRPIDSDFYEELMYTIDRDPFIFKLVPAWLIILLLIIGFSGNIVNILVYTRPFMRSGISLLLVSLEVVNLFLYATHIYSLSVHFDHAFKYSHFGVFMETSYMPTLTFFSGFSNWLTVFIGIWGCVAVAFPSKAEKWCGPVRTKLTMLIIGLFSLVVASPQFFMFSFRRVAFWEVTYHKNTDKAYSKNIPIYEVLPSPLLCHFPDLGKVAQRFLLMSFTIPCIIMGVVTVLFLVCLCLAQRKRNHSTAIPSNRQIDWVRETRFSVLQGLLVFLYFLAHLPFSIYIIKLQKNPSAEEFFEEYFFKVAVTGITVLACNASTFFIYYAMSARFRQVLHSMVIPSRSRNDQVRKSALTMSSVTNN